MSEMELATVESNPMAMLMKLAERGGVIEPAIVEKFMDLSERWEASQAVKSYAQAVAEFQAACPRIYKRREAAFNGKTAYYFASLDDIMAVVQPILGECGLSVSFDTRMADGLIEAACIVRHGIHTERHSVTLPLPADMRVNDTQKAGAALSYAKRYALCAALNIVVTDEDTDAAGMAETITEEQAIKLQEMLEAVGEGDARFLRWAGVERVADLPAAKYAEAVAVLKKKLAERGR